MKKFLSDTEFQARAYGQEPSNDSDFATKKYVDDNAGGSTGGFLETFSIGSSFDKGTFAQETYAVKVIAQSDFDIDTLATFLANVNSTAPTIELGIYDKDEDLIESATTDPSSSGIITVSLSSSVSLTKGETYWLAICNQTDETTTDALWHNSSGTLNSVIRYSGGTSSLPSTLPTGDSGRAYFIYGY